MGLYDIDHRRSENRGNTQLFQFSQDVGVSPARFAGKPHHEVTDCFCGARPTSFLRLLGEVRGAEGGFMLVRSPNDISLLELIEAIDGPLKANLPSTTGLPIAQQSKLQDALHSVTTTSRLQLESIKLSQLMSPAALASVD